MVVERVGPGLSSGAEVGLPGTKGSIKLKDPGCARLRTTALIGATKWRGIREARACKSQACTHHGFNATHDGPSMTVYLAQRLGAAKSGRAAASVPPVREWVLWDQDRLVQVNPPYLFGWGLFDSFGAFALQLGP